MSTATHMNNLRNATELYVNSQLAEKELNKIENALKNRNLKVYASTKSRKKKLLRKISKICPEFGEILRSNYVMGFITIAVGIAITLSMLYGISPEVEDIIFISIMCGMAFSSLTFGVLWLGQFLYSRAKKYGGTGLMTVDQQIAAIDGNVLKMTSVEIHDLPRRTVKTCEIDLEKNDEIRYNVLYDRLEIDGVWTEKKIYIDGEARGNDAGDISNSGTFYLYNVYDQMDELKSKIEHVHHKEIVNTKEIDQNMFTIPESNTLRESKIWLKIKDKIYFLIVAFIGILTYLEYTGNDTFGIAHPKGKINLYLIMAGLIVAGLLCIVHMAAKKWNLLFNKWAESLYLLAILLSSCMLLIKNDITTQHLTYLLRGKDYLEIIGGYKVQIIMVALIFSFGLIQRIALSEGFRKSSFGTTALIVYGIGCLIYLYSSIKTNNSYPSFVRHESNFAPFLKVIVVTSAYRAGALLTSKTKIIKDQWYYQKRHQRKHGLEK